MKFTTKLLDKKEVAKETTAFSFTKPPGYSFSSGQHTDWKEIDPPKTDAEGPIRTFSFASSPHEDFLMVATRMRNTAFKNVFKEMPIGTTVEIDEPAGDMVLHKDSSRPAVFLAGGIGITPFHSMVVDAAYKKLPHQIFLFYSNRTPEEAPFLEELKNVDNSNYHFMPVFTATSGHITKETLEKYIPDLTKPVYYLAGPPKFVLAMRQILSSAGVDDLSIRSEEFEGY